MACPSGTNNCKRYRQISLVEMCKIPKVSQSQSGSTNNTDHYADCQKIARAFINNERREGSLGDSPALKYKILN